MKKAKPHDRIKPLNELAMNSQGATEHLLSSPPNAKRLRDALETPRSDYLVFETMKDLEDALGI